MTSFFKSRENVRQLFGLVILIALLFYGLGLGVWAFTQWGTAQVATVSSPTPEASVAVTLSPSSKITSVPANLPSTTLPQESSETLSITDTIPPVSVTPDDFPTAGTEPSKSPTAEPTNIPIPQATRTNTPLPVLVPTNTKVPVFVPTKTPVPIFVPTKTPLPVFVPTKTQVPVLPSSTSIPTPTNTQVVEDVTPEPLEPTVTSVSTSISVPVTAEPLPIEATVVGIELTPSNSNDSGTQIATPTTQAEE